MISLSLLNPKNHTVSEEVMRNLLKLSRAMTQFEVEYAEILHVTSGYRTPEEQGITDAAHPRSAHVMGLACDCLDEKKEVWNYCLDNVPLLQKLSLYIEDKLYTPKHVHFQLTPPKSGHRFFIP